MTFWGVAIKQPTLSDAFLIAVFVSVCLVVVPDVQLNTIFALVGGCAVTIFGFSPSEYPIKALTLTLVSAPFMSALGLAIQNLFQL